MEIAAPLVLTKRTIVSIETKASRDENRGGEEEREIKEKNRSKNAINESNPGFAIALQQTVADEMEEVQQ